jgi:hypothetical protein
LRYGAAGPRQRGGPDKARPPHSAQFASGFGRSWMWFTYPSLVSVNFGKYEL